MSFPAAASTPAPGGRTRCGSKRQRGGRLGPVPKEANLLVESGRLGKSPHGESRRAGACGRAQLLLLEKLAKEEGLPLQPKPRELAEDVVIIGYARDDLTQEKFGKMVEGSVYDVSLYATRES